MKDYAKVENKLVLSDMRTRYDNDMKLKKSNNNEM